MGKESSEWENTTLRDFLNGKKRKSKDPDLGVKLPSLKPYCSHQTREVKNNNDNTVYRKERRLQLNTSEATPTAA
jgi:hypothetical protein